MRNDKLFDNLTVGTIYFYKICTGRQMVHADGAEILCTEIRSPLIHYFALHIIDSDFCSLCVAPVKINVQRIYGRNRVNVSIIGRSYYRLYRYVA